MTFFEVSCGRRYHNPRKAFSSYFLTFAQGARIELMYNPSIAKSIEKHSTLGLAHFAISVGSKKQVDALTEAIRKRGYEIISEPRTTGDGYYESVISDCEGNWIEITV